MTEISIHPKRLESIVEVSKALNLDSETVLNEAIYTYCKYIEDCLKEGARPEDIRILSDFEWVFDVGE